MRPEKDTMPTLGSPWKEGGRGLGGELGGDNLTAAQLISPLTWAAGLGLKNARGDTWLPKEGGKRAFKRARKKGLSRSCCVGRVDLGQACGGGFVLEGAGKLLKIRPQVAACGEKKADGESDRGSALVPSAAVYFR